MNTHIQSNFQSRLFKIIASTNSGDSSSAPSDCVLLAFIDRVVAASDAQLPLTPSTPSSISPREALVAFQRSHSIAPGDFKLECNSVFAAFRNEHGRVQPPLGTYQMRIGHSRGESGARLIITVASSLFDGVETGRLSLNRELKRNKIWSIPNFALLFVVFVPDKSSTKRPAVRIYFSRISISFWS